MRLIPLYRRDGTITGYALVDEEDFGRLNEYRWYENSGYAKRSEWRDGRVHVVLMHREVLGLQPGDEREADHINRNKLDNRRQNLRAVTHAQNNQNVSPKRGRYRAVYYEPDRGKWRARVRMNGKSHHIGRFDTEEEAGQASAAFLAEYLPFSNPTR